MYYSEETLDDLMRKVLAELLNRPYNVKATKGKTSEILGAMLHLTNPRARLSRSETKGKTFSTLGELLWYLSKSNSLDLIQYYIPEYKKESDDGKTIYGAYGPRLFKLRRNTNQIKNILDLLTQRPTTRQAVIQLFDGADLNEKHRNIPCTCSIQFLLRDGKLNMFTSMRSNDAFLGLPHDIFTFTMLQEIFARTLNVEIGVYTHAAGSLHLYEKHREKAADYVNEGLQSTREIMPNMPMGNPWPEISNVLKAELKIRKGVDIGEIKMSKESYWNDLIYLLEIFSFSKKNNLKGAERSKKNITSPVYHTYIDQKMKSIKTKHD